MSALLTSNKLLQEETFILNRITVENTWFMKAFFWKSPSGMGLSLTERSCEPASVFPWVLMTRLFGERL